MSYTRDLTERELQFVKEAKEGGFLTGYDDNGAPFAQGAEGTDNLFSMEVESAQEPADPEVWTYFLPENTELAARFR
jgi:hypothetical protein